MMSPTKTWNHSRHSSQVEGKNLTLVLRKVNKRRSSVAIFSVEGGSEMTQHDIAENFNKNRYPLVCEEAGS